MTQPLYVAIIWHMHQPVYKDLTGSYTAPWVRLHAVRDYLHMAELLADYPNVHVTFNLVPSLLGQLADYAAGSALDRALALSRQEVWSADDESELLSTFFQVNRKTVLDRYPAFRRLFRLALEAEERTELLSPAFYRDLVAWFNLAWIDSSRIHEDRDLRALAQKGHGFSNEDIRLILDRQADIIRRIIPLYRDLAQSGHVELTTSPYSHPVLPLLYNTAFAAQASPGLTLPGRAFVHPEDAREQLRRAVQAHRVHLDAQPSGLWPPEGGVCQAMLDDVAAAGFSWLASDENVLLRSLRLAELDGHGPAVAPERLYRPYRVRTDLGPREITVVFRDRTLSDQIGFSYAHMDAGRAVEDFVGRLRWIARGLSASPHLVTVALDGENCWDGYEGNGEAFLRGLYGTLSTDPVLRTVMVSEYLEAHPAQSCLPELAAGSWIPNGFETWVGQPAQNVAWELLRQTRSDLVRQQQSPSDSGQVSPGADLAGAWEQLSISEGSDWFWWYFDHNSIDGKNPFDELFRSHLGAVYRLAGLPVPDRLNQPVNVRSA